MHCPSAGGGESGNGIAHVAFRSISGAKIVRACARSTGLPQLSARHAEALPYSFSRSCITVSISPYTVQLQPPARHSKEIVRTASGAAAVRFRPPPLQPQPALYRRRAARIGGRNACIGAISYRQHDCADRKGDKPLAFREFLNLRQHIKEFAPGVSPPS